MGSNEGEVPEWDELTAVAVDDRLSAGEGKGRFELKVVVDGSV
jgi:hypothetical protein